MRQGYTDIDLHEYVGYIPQKTAEDALAEIYEYVGYIPQTETNDLLKEPSAKSREDLIAEDLNVFWQRVESQKEKLIQAIHRNSKYSLKFLREQSISALWDLWGSTKTPSFPAHEFTVAYRNMTQN